MTQEVWVCGWCMEGVHDRCPEVAGCGCAGQDEMTCACAEAKHKVGTRTGRMSMK